jgi:hypothetical protein
LSASLACAAIMSGSLLLVAAALDAAARPAVFPDRATETKSGEKTTKHYKVDGLFTDNPDLFPR